MTRPGDRGAAGAPTATRLTGGAARLEGGGQSPGWLLPAAGRLSPWLLWWQARGVGHALRILTC